MNIPARFTARTAAVSELRASKGPRGESKDARSTATWCPRQVPLPTLWNLPSPLTTALLDRRPQCIDHLVDGNRGADDHVRCRSGRRTPPSSSHFVGLIHRRATVDRWGNDACSRRACTSLRLAHIPPARRRCARSARSLSFEDQTISVRPTLAPLYQFYRDTSLPPVPLYPGIHNTGAHPTEILVGAGLGLVMGYVATAVAVRSRWVRRGLVVASDRPQIAQPLLFCVLFELATVFDSARSLARVLWETFRNAVLAR